MKPTREKIDEARIRLGVLFSELQTRGIKLNSHADAFALFKTLEAIAGHVNTLVLATEPEEPPPDPRPDDMAELARQVATELRKRGIWARVDNDTGLVVVPRRDTRKERDLYGIDWFLLLTRSEFVNLGPRAIANVIQTEEARKAQEWAGDA